MMASRDTKRIIKEEALKLFSIKGYGAVSIRDISGAVGIKESSIYNHFKNKRAILDDIITDFNEKSAQIFDQFELDEDGLLKIVRDSNALTEITMRLFRFYIGDDFVAKCRRLLTIEQYSSETLRTVYCDTFIIAPVMWNSMLFGKLIENGFLKPRDPLVMAYQFYSPIIVLIQEFDGGGIGIDQAAELIRAHTAEFTEAYKA